MKHQKKKSARQIAAICGIAFLLLLYLATLISAVIAFPGWQRMFSASVIGTITVPILLWLYIGMYGVYTRKHTIASMDLLEDPHKPEEDTETSKES